MVGSGGRGEGGKRFRAEIFVGEERRDEKSQKVEMSGEHFFAKDSHGNPTCYRGFVSHDAHVAKHIAFTRSVRVVCDFKKRFQRVIGI